ncbi:hypothetical protein, partial [uncultured Rhizobium sp.]|uniref:hypothetical protein n=1 Tax=uncultured Rhizobium sp. TaxID=155567 RepID=UPI0026296510
LSSQLNQFCLKGADVGQAKRPMVPKMILESARFNAGTLANFTTEISNAVKSYTSLLNDM